MMNRNLVRNLTYKLPKDSPAHLLAKALENGYLKSQRDQAIVDKTTFAPSSIAAYSGTCPRRWVMAFADKYMSSETNDALGMAVMQHGSAAHDRIQAALELAGVVIENEREVPYDDPPIRGFVDSIIELEGIKYVVEIKTMPLEKYFMRETAMQGLDPHYYQLLFYMHILDIPQGFLLYENRNDLGVVTIPVFMDDHNKKVVEEAFTWMREVYQFAKETDELPKRPFTKSSYACKFCPLKTACWTEAPDGELYIAPMEVNGNW